MLDRISIVMAYITHPGNIGASARAMKTMGFRRLRLVSPRGFPGAEITARAAGADDVLASASVYESLKDSIADCSLVYATSARIRGLSCPVLDPVQAAGNIATHVAAGAQAAVLFGQERTGLSNSDLELCNGMIRIPTDPGFTSLNVAAAVQLICYELRRLLVRPQVTPAVPAGNAASVSSSDMEQFYDHLERTLVDIGFMDPARPRRLMRRMRGLFNRARLDSNEYNILRGILAAAQRKSRDGEK